MSDFLTAPKENQYKSQIVGELLETTVAPFVLTLKNAPGFTITPGEFVYFVVQPGTVNEEGLKVSTITGNQVTVTVRGLPTYEGGPSTTASHGGGSTIIISNNWQLYDDMSTSVNSKYDKTGGILTGPIQFDDVNVEINRVGDDMVFKDVNQSSVTLSALAAAAGTDEKAKVSANDTTAGYFNGKLIGGKKVTLTENNDGGDETLSVNVPNSAFYAVDSVGTDAYALTLAPALTSYEDGQPLTLNPGTFNTGPSTVNANGLGAIPIVKGNYNALETNDLFKNSDVDLRVNIRTVTFTAGLAMAAVSGTLTGNWAYKTGVYSVLFSNGDRRDVTLTNGATSATWSGGLSAAATANAVAQFAQLVTYPASLVGGLNSSEQHYHDLVRNNSLSRRVYLYGDNSDGVAGGAVSEVSGKKTVTTAASNNAMAAQTFYAWDLAGTLQVNTSNRSPSFRLVVGFTEATAQEGFIGWCPFAMAGTSLENSVMTLDHFGFIVQDGTLFISVADGATQTKTDISATVPSVTAGHIFEGYFDGTTATFYVDNALVGSLNTNVPNSSMDTFRVAVIADATNAAKSVKMLSSGWVAYNET